jgi:branched-chain amino acid transport system substrate-binding protein
VNSRARGVRAWPRRAQQRNGAFDGRIPVTQTKEESAMLKGIRNLMCAMGLGVLSLGIGLSSAEAQGTFKIGAPASLSGKYASYGVQAKNGIEHAIETWKATRGDSVAGRKIELILADTQSDNALTVSIMNDMIQTRKVDVIIGPDGSNVAAAAVPPWKKFKERPIWILPGGSTSKIEQEVGPDPYFFHTYAWAYYYHANNVDALKAAIGTKKKVAFVYTDGAYGRAHIDDARRYVKEAGFEIVASELVREGAADFNSAIIKVRAMRPDVLYAVMQTTDAVQFTKQIFTAKTGIPHLVGTAQAQLVEWQDAVGEAQNCWTGVTTWVNGLAFPADPREPKLLPAAAAWEAAWKAKYGKEAEFLEVGYYVSTVLALLAVEATKSVDRDALKNWLEGQDYKSPMGLSSKFKPSEITPHQAFDNMVVFQRVKEGSGYVSKIVYPKEIATGTLQTCKP